MKLLGPNEWAKRTARRLRVSHHSFADQTFEEKREFLEDELDFALGDVGAESGPMREKYLDALADLFPVFGDLGMDSALMPARSQEDQKPAEKRMTPSEMVLEGWATAGENERADLIAKLGLKTPAPVATTGAMVPESVSMPEDEAGLADLERTMSRVKGFFRIADDEQVSFTRLFKLLGMLADHFDKLHAFVWDFWESMCPRDLEGTIEPLLHGKLAASVRSYLLAEGDVSSQELSNDVSMTRLLALAACSSIKQGGEEFGRQFGSRFSPDEIESSVIIEDTGGDPSRVKELEKKSWAKYRQLAKNLTPEGVDDEFQVLLGRIMAAWMKRNKK